MILLSINLFIQSNFRKYIKELLKAKDERLKITAETVNCLKIFIMLYFKKYNLWLFIKVT